jgi:hypothetical protein
MPRPNWRGRRWSDAVSEEDFQPTRIAHPHDPGKTEWTTAEVIKDVPGLTTRQLHYLCQSGRMGQAQIDPGRQRVFTLAEVALLRRFANLREAGLDLPSAFRMASIMPGTPVELTPHVVVTYTE